MLKGLWANILYAAKYICYSFLIMIVLAQVGYEDLPTLFVLFSIFVVPFILAVPYPRGETNT